MKVIKFRAWNPVYGMEKLNGLRRPPYEDSKRAYHCDEGEEDESDTVIMQYTGLKDKNNKDIFDCDILDISSSYHSGKYLSVVRFDDAVSGVQLDTFKDDCKIGVLGRKWWGDQKCQHMYEVIGNIYENPELLLTNK